MAHFESYNTSDPNTGATPLAANGNISPFIINTQQDGVLTYSCYSDQPGNLYISQSFDGGAHWDFTTTVAVTGGAVNAQGNYPGVGGQISVYAPLVRVQYYNGATIQTVLRLFVRTFGSKTG